MLSVTSVPTFASHWLAANIGLFQLGQSGDRGAGRKLRRIWWTSAAEEFDVGIRATSRLQAGLVWHLLVKAEFAPMLQPQLVEEYQVREPADLLRVPQITPDDPWLCAWLELAGVSDAADQRSSLQPAGLTSTWRPRPPLRDAAWLW